MYKTALAAFTGAFLATGTLANTPVPFSYPWSIQGPTAPYLLAEDNGYFAHAGLEVEMLIGQGSVESVARVASGALPLGFADINALITFLDRNPDAPVTAVMVVFDRPPYSVIGRKSQGFTELKDIEGRILGAPPSDAAWAQLPVLADINKINMETVEVEPVGFATREAMLAGGRVDAVTGFSYSSYFNLLGMGVPKDDLVIVAMADHGLELYGNAIIVNTDFAEKNPKAVSGFLSAFAQGLQAASDDPSAAIDSVVLRNPAADRELELERLGFVLDNFILTDYALENGIGGIDSERFERGIEQLQQAGQISGEPTPEKYFTDAFLPKDNFQLHNETLAEQHY